MEGASPLRLAEARFGKDAVDAIAAVLASGRLTQGPRTEEFERSVARYCRTDHAVATTSATTALQLVLAALDIGPGDEVLVADFTYPATGNVVLQQGAVLRLVDIDPLTYNIDPAALADSITDRTRLVIATDTFGLAANYPAFEGLLEERGIPLLCDAACALGAEVGGRRCGAIGLAGCFSFHPRKILTTGEGGMVTTSDAELAQRMRRLRNHGSERTGWRSSFVEVGFNFRMSEIQAALGSVQLPGYEEVIGARRRLAKRLAGALQRIAGIRSPTEPPGFRHTYQAFVTLLDEGIDRDQVIERCREQGVEATLGTYALHAEPAFRETCGTRPGELSASWRCFRHSLALPLHHGMSEQDVDRIAATVERALSHIG